jgi:hypothetical protein
MNQSMTNGKNLDLEYAMWVLARPYTRLVWILILGFIYTKVDILI